MSTKVRLPLLLLMAMTVTLVHSLPLDEDDGPPPTVVPETINLPTSENDSKNGHVVSLGFVHAFVASLSVIVVSELGDKTFFIAAIMAMRHSRITVFAGAISALALMTVLSGNINNIPVYIKYKTCKSALIFKIVLQT